MDIVLDARALLKLEHMEDWQPGTYYYDAMGQSLDGVQNYAVNFMFATFKNPSGKLEGNFIQTISPGINSIQGELANPTDYAWRRNSGFHGTDALGRHYNDDGIYFMEGALDAQRDVILERFRLAVERSLTDLAGV